MIFPVKFEEEKNGKERIHAVLLRWKAMIYVVGNSVAVRGQPTYAQMLGGKLIKSFHMYFYTVLGAIYETQNLVLEDDDWVVFNFGVNDCIYRKDKRGQTKLLHELCERVQEDKLAYEYYREKLEIFKKKKRNELIQLLTYDQFAKYIDIVFARFHGKAIVLSVNWFDRTDKKIGWAYEEVNETNRILKEKALQYLMPYIDLFKPPSVTTDGVHFTQEGHKLVVSLIREAINRKLASPDNELIILSK